MTGHGLRADAISFRIGGRTVFDRVTLTVQPGEMVGVRGPSGSGKTTLLLFLAGLDRPTEGDVWLNGHTLHEHGENVRQQIGFVFQHFGLISYLTATENVALPLPGRHPVREDIQGRARAALVEVGLEEVSERLVEDLSGGQQQRVAVARGLIGEPDLVVADESTSELDAENRANVIALLARRARDGGMVVASSDDSDLLDACDRIFDLANGRLTLVSPKVQP
jgi:putative ABC transport system ATP-binding protein